eukprot:GHVP01032984.1.p1 GENE.GHVP01032984.1~~GHVP01032984.1.p1  ORF type:complete len:611 (+),score=81.15 GHVP01032984.1:2254-4086(+)
MNFKTDALCPSTSSEECGGTASYDPAANLDRQEYYPSAFHPVVYMPSNPHFQTQTTDHSGLQQMPADHTQDQNSMYSFGGPYGSQSNGNNIGVFTRGNHQVNSSSGPPLSGLYSTILSGRRDNSPLEYSEQERNNSALSTLQQSDSEDQDDNRSTGRVKKGSPARKILKQVRWMWLSHMPEGRHREISFFILDKHGGQMPYDRQYWSYAYKSNRLTDRDEQTKSNIEKGVETLKRFVQQVEEAGEIVRSFMTDPERSKQIPSDLTDDYLKQWLSGPNAMLIRKLINNDPEVREVPLPTCLHSENLGRALSHGGLLIRIPSHSQRMFDHFNLLSPGRGDTRHTELAIPDGGEDIDVKKSRTQLAFPTCYFPENVPLPKVCVFQIDAKLELLLFYRGNNQKRLRPRKQSCAIDSPYQSVYSSNSMLDENSPSRHSEPRTRKRAHEETHRSYTPLNDFKEESFSSYSKIVRLKADDSCGSDDPPYDEQQQHAGNDISKLVNASCRQLGTEAKAISNVRAVRLTNQIDNSPSSSPYYNLNQNTSGCLDPCLNTVLVQCQDDRFLLLSTAELPTVPFAQVVTKAEVVPPPTPAGRNALGFFASRQQCCVWRARAY